VFPSTLKKRAEFVKITKFGSRAKTDNVISICYGGDSDLPNVGYVASKKIGNAVKRNRAKRRLRVIVREFASEFQAGYSFIFIATLTTGTCDFSKLKSDFLYCLKRSQERENQKTSA
jgi:ribonuclease P protein component